MFNDTSVKKLSEFMSAIRTPINQSNNESCITQFSTRIHFTVDEEKFILLSNEAIHYVTPASRKKHGQVPPSTPDYDIDYQQPIEPTLLHVDQVRVKELPKVSDRGIKFTIETLGEQLGFTDYEYDLVQFWLLDMLTDCIWKAQDVFQFDDVQLKVLLEWISALFQLIADPHLNLTRNEFLALFERILHEVHEQIATTCEAFPSVKVIPKLVNIFCEESRKRENTQDDESNSDSDSSPDSTSSFSMRSQDTWHFTKSAEFNMQEYINYLKSHNPLGNIFHGHVYSDSGSEAQIPSVSEEASSGASECTTLLGVEENTSSSSIRNTDEFGNAARFLHPLDPVCGCHLSPSKIYCTCVNRYLEPGEDRDLEYYSMFNDQWDFMPKEETASSTTKTQSVPVLDQKTDRLTNSDILSDIQASGGEQNETSKDLETCANEDDVDDEDKAREKELLKEWAYFKLMEQRNSDMNDARIGWMPWQSWLNERNRPKVIVKGVVNAYVAFKGHHSSITHPKVCTTPIRQLNFNILRAIIDFVFNYFHEDFHFTLIKFAFRYPPNFITQNINKEWSIPKVMKDQFKRPKETSKPKELKPQESKEKAKLAAKSESGKLVAEDKSKEKDKMEQKTNDKLKQSPKDANNGKHIVTGEEKAELERQHLEEVRLEQEKLAAEVQRIYIFPLADAASENLFMSVFDNWASSKVSNHPDRNVSNEKKIDKGRKKGKKA